MALHFDYASASATTSSKRPAATAMRGSSYNAPLALRFLYSFKERGALESGLAILATIGSISPFVGLFGTVWGIMGALTNISKSGSASLEVVAGPIGEALVATAVGIAVAVPAVIGYNFFIRRNKVIWAFLDDFAIDFVHLALKTSFLIRRPASNPVAASARAGGNAAKKSLLKSTGHEDLQVEGVQI